VYQKRGMHLRKLFSAESSVNRPPFVSLGEGPIAMAVQVPVQFSYALFHTLHESVDRAHAVLRVLRTTLERRQGDDAVIYDNPNLLGRGEGGVSARENCLREEVEMVVNGCSFWRWRTGNSRWNWMLVAKGASSAERKDLFSGIWS